MLLSSSRSQYSISNTRASADQMVAKKKKKKKNVKDRYVRSRRSRAAPAMAGVHAYLITSPGELEMTCSTSEVAASRSNASASFFSSLSMANSQNPRRNG